MYMPIYVYAYIHTVHYRTFSFFLKRTQIDGFKQIQTTHLSTKDPLALWRRPVATLDSHFSSQVQIIIMYVE